jgi:putative peptidoglycan lipid II flippase
VTHVQPDDSTGSIPPRSAGLLSKNIGVALGTAMSRLTGLARVAMLASVLTKGLPDAYNQANNTPNIIYELLLGGVLSATLVPVMTRLHHDNDDDGAVAVTSVGIVVLVAITIVAVAAAPLIFHVYNISTSSAVDAGVYRSVGTTLTRMFLVQILFYGVNAFGTAMLNARNRFLAAAWAPSLANIAILASLVVVARHGSTTLVAAHHDSFTLRVLGLGATGGIAVMTLALLPSLIRSKAPLRFRPDFHHPAVRTLMRLSGWALGYAIANQVAVIVVQNLTRPGSGANIAYTVGFTVFILPHALFAVSLTTTLRPEITRAIARHDKATMIARSSLGLRVTALLTIPAGCGLFALRHPIAASFFGFHGTSGGDINLRARAIGGFALGLGAFSVYLFTLSTFNAHQDAKTPFIINVVENLINIALAIPLSAKFGVLGLSASFAIAYGVSSVVALLVLRIKVPGYPLGSIVSSVWRMYLAAIVMAEVAWIISDEIGGSRLRDNVLRLGAGAVGGIVVYGVLLYLLRSPEVAEIRQLGQRRRAGSTTD